MLNYLWQYISNLDLNSAQIVSCSAVVKFGRLSNISPFMFCTIIIVTGNLLNCIPELQRFTIIIMSGFIVISSGHMCAMLGMGATYSHPLQRAQ